MKSTFVLLTILIIHINLVDGVKADPSSIIIENADAIVENYLVNSTDLDDTSQNVDPRIVVEYADVIVESDLVNSTNLNNTVQDVDPRIIVEYADAIVEENLGNSTHNVEITHMDNKVLWLKRIWIEPDFVSDPGNPIKEYVGPNYFLIFSVILIATIPAIVIIWYERKKS